MRKLQSFDNMLYGVTCYHDLQPNRAYREVSTTAHKIQQIGRKQVNLKKENKIAKHFPHDSDEAIIFMPFDNS